MSRRTRPRRSGRRYQIDDSGTDGASARGGRARAGLRGRQNRRGRRRARQERQRLQKDCKRNRGGRIAMIEGLFQPTHLILILAIVLIVFGPGKLPEVGSSLGKSIRDFRKSARDEAGAVEIPAGKTESLAVGRQ